MLADDQPSQREETPAHGPGRCGLGEVERTGALVGTGAHAESEARRPGQNHRVPRRAGERGGAGRSARAQLGEEAFARAAGRAMASEESIAEVLSATSEVPADSHRGAMTDSGSAARAKRA